MFDTALGFVVSIASALPKKQVQVQILRAAAQFPWQVVTPPSLLYMQNGDQC